MKELEKEAEEYAIEFAEWRDKYLAELNKWKLNGECCGNKFTTKELFDIFKEQKNKKHE